MRKSESANVPALKGKAGKGAAEGVGEGVVVKEADASGANEYDNTPAMEACPGSAEVTE